MSNYARLLKKDWAGLAAIVLVGFLTLMVLFPAFRDGYNFYVLLRSLCVVLMVAFAQMITLAVGQINLSVGAIGGFIAIIFGGLMERLGVPVLLAVPAVLALGAIAGYINGALTVYTGINGFIITLATASAFTGINYGITESIPFYNMPSSLIEFGTGRVLVFPYLLFPPVIAAVLLAFFLYRTVPGRWLLAAGGNPHAAELSGIPKGRIIILAHVLSGLLAAVGAVLAVAQLGSAQPEIGSDWLIISFAAPIIGGAALNGGHVSVAATALAVVIIVLIENTMVIAQVDSYWVEFLLGILILVVVGLNQVRARRAEGMKS